MTIFTPKDWKAQLWLFLLLFWCLITIVNLLIEFLCIKNILNVDAVITLQPSNITVPTSQRPMEYLYNIFIFKYHLPKKIIINILFFSIRNIITKNLNHVKNIIMHLFQFFIIICKLYQANETFIWFIWTFNINS